MDSIQGSRQSPASGGSDRATLGANSTSMALTAPHSRIVARLFLLIRGIFAVLLEMDESQERLSLRSTGVDFIARTRRRDWSEVISLPTWAGAANGMILRQQSLSLLQSQASLH